MINGKRVVVTGVGPISSLGIGREEMWDSILNLRTNIVNEEYSINGEKWGEFCIHKMKDFNIAKFNLPRNNFRFIKEIRTVKEEDVDLYYFLAAIKLALDDSGIQYDLHYNDIGLMITHENPGAEILFDTLVDRVYEIVKTNKIRSMTRLKVAQLLYDDNCENAGYNMQTFSYLFSVAKVFDIHGYSLFINNACASGLFAIDSAARQIKEGISPAVIVAAVDNPTKIYKYIWFKKRALYSEDGLVRPFSNNSNGIVFGDGGAALILEDLEHAQKRGANIYAEYLGGGFSLEGWKIMVPDITNDFYTKSLEKALNASGIKPEKVDFINPHGVGLKITDSYEANTITAIFGNKQPFISAFKPLVGHNLGGSSLIETVIALLSLKNNMIPATLNCEDVNKKLKLNIVKDNTKVDLNIIIKMACGFAGFSGVSIFQKYKN